MKVINRRGSYHNNPSRHVKRKRKGKENFPPAPPIEKREGERKTVGEF